MNLVIVGAGGHAKVVFDILMQMPQSRRYPTKFIGFVDREPIISGNYITAGYNVIGSDALLDTPSWLHTHDMGYGNLPLAVILAVGNNHDRKRLYERFISKIHLNLMGCCHPSILWGHDAQGVHGLIGRSKLVAMGQARIGIDTRIGTNVILNTACNVEHDCVIGDHAHICPGAILLGGVEVGEGAVVGAGAVVLEGRKIGAWATVGAGAVVTKDVPENVIVKGIPAR